MKVLNVSLFNFCQFDKLSCDLREGTTRVYAPNGAGKTNFFRGIVYALTGWCDPSWGTQSDLQKDDASAPGYAQVTLDIDGHIHTLRRYIITSPKTGDSIDCPDLKVHIEKRQRVNAYLEEHLPVNVTILAQLMWIRQLNLSWLLTATPASINTFLGLIFDTKPLEKLRDVLKVITSGIADIRGDQDERIAHWQGVLEQLPDIPQLEQQVKELDERYVELASYSGKRVIRKSDWEKTREALANMIQEESGVISALVKAIAEAKAALPDPLPNVAALREELRQEQECANTLMQDIQNCRDAVTKWQETMKVLADADSQVCKFCGSQFYSSQEHKNAVLSQLGIKEDYETACNEVQKNVDELSLIIEAKEQRLKDIKDVSLVRLENAINQALDFASLSSHVKAKEAELSQHNQNLSIWQDKLKILDEAVVINDNEQTIQEQLQSCKETMAAVRQCLQDAKSNKQMAEQSIEQLNKEKGEHEKNAYVKKLFTASRDVLSQSRAQARYINSKLDTLNSYIEHYLALSEMPFVLKLDKKLHQFRFHMVGNDAEHPAGMLSGAQQAASSIAIQMALVETAFPELSLLLVDEADSALSPENKFIAARLYRTLSQAIDGTVLVISQAEEVTADCDNTWELGK